PCHKARPVGSKRRDRLASPAPRRSRRRRTQPCGKSRQVLLPRAFSCLSPAFVAPRRRQSRVTYPCVRCLAARGGQDYQKGEHVAQGCCSFATSVSPTPASMTASPALLLLDIGAPRDVVPACNLGGDGADIVLRRAAERRDADGGEPRRHLIMASLRARNARHRVRAGRRGDQGRSVIIFITLRSSRQLLRERNHVWQDHPTILLVEDEFIVRLWTADELRAEGFHVVEAANADEALSLLQGAAPVDLIMTDVRIPDRWTAWGSQGLRTRRGRISRSLSFRRTCPQPPTTPSMRSSESPTIQTPSRPKSGGCLPPGGEAPTRCRGARLIV